MRKLKHKIIAFTTLVALGTCGATFAVPQKMSLPGTMEVQAGEDTGLKVDYHSQQEISAYINAHSAAMNFTTSYAATPNTKAPYATGQLSGETQNRAVELLNIIRYVAGIPYNVTADSQYALYAQAASLVNAANNRLSHFPAQPSGMSADLYALGAEGAGSSNIAMGYNLCAALKNGWMSDADSYNISCVGHRRWCLNPEMGKTGFGSVDRYTAMYSFDDSNTAASRYSRVAWPAQNTPDSLFSSKDPWSVSVGTALNANTVKVTLRCVNNGKTYSFSSSGADGEFYVDNQYYGQPGCIIFRPVDGTLCTAGYTYNVDITGKELSGQSFHINYNVNFFHVSEVVPAQWMQTNGRWWYRNADGSYPTGWAKIGSKWYLFDQSGWMLTGWQYTGGKWYYLEKNGAMATGWRQIGGVWYYFATSGAMETDWKQVGGLWYYFGSDGAMRANSWAMDKKGTWYYLGTNGDMKTDSWVKETYRLAKNSDYQDERDFYDWYYVGKDGAMVTDTWVADRAGLKYYLSKDGSMKKGGFVEQKGKTYFVNQDGVMLQGVIKINHPDANAEGDLKEGVYYFGEDGSMQTGTVRIGGEDYHFDKFGKCTDEMPPETDQLFDITGKVRKENR